MQALGVVVVVVVKAAVVEIGVSTMGEDGQVILLDLILFERAVVLPRVDELAHFYCG